MGASGAHSPTGRTSEARTQTWRPRRFRRRPHLPPVRLEPQERELCAIVAAHDRGLLVIVAGVRQQVWQRRLPAAGQEIDESSLRTVIAAHDGGGAVEPRLGRLPYLLVSPE